MRSREYTLDDLKKSVLNEPSFTLQPLFSQHLIVILDSLKEALSTQTQLTRSLDLSSTIIPMSIAEKMHYIFKYGQPDLTNVVDILHKIIDLLAIKSLNMSNNNLGNEPVIFTSICEMLIIPLPAISLNLSANNLNRLSSQCWNIFCQKLRQSQIIELDVSNNGLSALQLAEVNTIIENNKTKENIRNERFNSLAHMTAAFYVKNKSTLFQHRNIDLLPQDCKELIRYQTTREDTLNLLNRQVKK